MFQKPSIHWVLKLKSRGVEPLCMCVPILNKMQCQCFSGASFTPWQRKWYFVTPHLKLSIVKKVLVTFLGCRLSGVLATILKMTLVSAIQFCSLTMGTLNFTKQIQYMLITSKGKESLNKKAHSVPFDISSNKSRAAKIKTALEIKYFGYLYSEKWVPSRIPLSSV